MVVFCFSSDPDDTVAASVEGTFLNVTPIDAALPKQQETSVDASACSIEISHSRYQK